MTIKEVIWTLYTALFPVWSLLGVLIFIALLLYVTKRVDSSEQNKS